MLGRHQRFAALALFCALAVGVRVVAAEIARTTVTVDRLCNACAAKIEARLKAMPGVTSTAADVKAKTIVIGAQPKAVLSPRALWEAIEGAGERPIKLAGPSGTFTAKPDR